jgi:hypothetical protein
MGFADWKSLIFNIICGILAKSSVGYRIYNVDWFLAFISTCRVGSKGNFRKTFLNQFEDRKEAIADET